jgi:hypothetical protein
MPKIVVTVNNTELTSLLNLALAELRRPQDQLRFILRKELSRHGLHDNKLKKSEERFNIPSSAFSTDHQKT